MSKLKPCPFCGGRVEEMTGITGLTMIVCSRCKATVSFGGKERKDQATSAWNRRAMG